MDTKTPETAAQLLAGHLIEGHGQSIDPGCTDRLFLDSLHRIVHEQNDLGPPLDDDMLLRSHLIHVHGGWVVGMNATLADLQKLHQLAHQDHIAFKVALDHERAAARSRLAAAVLEMRARHAQARLVR